MAKAVNENTCSGQCLIKPVGIIPSIMRFKTDEDACKHCEQGVSYGKSADSSVQTHTSEEHRVALERTHLHHLLQAGREDDQATILEHADLIDVDQRQVRNQRYAELTSASRLSA